VQKVPFKDALVLDDDPVLSGAAPLVKKWREGGSFLP
jgi:hypothetical protein